MTNNSLYDKNYNNSTIVFTIKLSNLICNYKSLDFKFIKSKRKATLNTIMRHCSQNTFIYIIQNISLRLGRYYVIFSTL